MNYLALIPVVAGFLFIVSILDLKFKKIPSILLTSLIFMVVFLNPENLIFGVLSSIFALLIYEADFIGGIADIKVIAVIGMMINSYFYFVGFILLVMVYGFFWKVINKWRNKEDNEVAFIPALFFVYIVLWILGGLG